MAKFLSLLAALALALPLLCALPVAATNGASRRLMQSPLPAVTAPLTPALAPTPVLTSAPLTVPPVIVPLPPTQAPTPLPTISFPTSALTSAPVTLPPVIVPLPTTPSPTPLPTTPAPTPLPTTLAPTPMPTTPFPTFAPGPVTWTASFDTNSVGSDLLAQFNAPGVTTSPACFNTGFVPPLNAPLVNPLTQCETLCATWQTVVPGAPACVAFVAIKVVPAAGAAAPAKNCCFLKSAATAAKGAAGFDLYVRNVT